MKIIRDKKRMDHYLVKYGIDQMFTDFEAFRPFFSLMEYPSRAYIHFGEDNERYLCFFVKGRFKVYGNLSDGKRILYRFCNPGMLMGEMEFIHGDRKPIEANVETVEPCLVLALNYESIREQLKQDAKFLWCLCEIIAEKMAYFGNMEMVNNLHTAQGKLAAYLLNCAGGTDIFCENQRIVAEQLNISYRHLHRVLKNFVDCGYLIRVGHSYRITDREGLKACIQSGFW